MSLHTGSATGPVVNVVTNSTTAGAGSTITAGSGTTGVYSGTAGSDYYLTEDPAGGADLTNYNATITCTDANGFQTGLPTNATFSGSLELTPVKGAVISCILTNHPLSPGVSIDKVATVSPSTDSGGAQVGDTIAYSYKVTNMGTVDLAGDGHGPDARSQRHQLPGGGARPTRGRDLHGHLYDHHGRHPPRQGGQRWDRDGDQPRRSNDHRSLPSVIDRRCALCRPTVVS